MFNSATSIESKPSKGYFQFQLILTAINSCDSKRIVVAKCILLIISLKDIYCYKQLELNSIKP